MSQRNRSNRGLGSAQDAKEVKEQNDRLKALSFNGSRSHRLQNLSQDRGSRVSGRPADLGSQGSFAASHISRVPDLAPFQLMNLAHEVYSYR